MTRGANKLLSESEVLPDRARAETAAEILRRTALRPHDLPKDEDLVAVADSLFVDLDRRKV